MPNQYTRVTPTERFWSKVDTSGECWMWTGCCDSDGYGKFSAGKLDGREHLRAHRFSYELAFGSIPPGLQVLHSCDTPGCVRPEHLFLGTNADNVDDRTAKGRAARGAKISETRTVLRGDAHPARVCPDYLPRGERHGMTSLTVEQVKAIRLRYAEGLSSRTLAREYGVHPTTITNIVHRRTWGHVA